MSPTNVIGWLGISLILAGYGGITSGLVNPEGVAYALLNITGAAGIIYSSFSKKDYQPVALNVVWIVIAAVGLVRALV